MFGILFDDAGNPKLTTQALELTNQLRKTIDSLKTPQNDVTGMLSEIGTIVQGNQLIADLTQLSTQVGGVSLQVNDEPGIPIDQPRQDTAKFYHFVESIGKATRQKQNDQAYAIVDQFLKGELKQADITDEQRLILGKYSGNGGNLEDNHTGQEGSAFEYYTPVPIASGIWDALREMGFNGGKVLDPCAGTGIFGATAPLNAAVDSVELDTTSGTVNKLINESASYKVTVSNFEKVAAGTPDEIYDAVVTNVPFGENREGNQFDDDKYQDQSLENYFILRSLDKLKPGGLAAFLVPPRCTDGKGGSPEKLRFNASLKAEFLGAYRLPSKVFTAAGADTITDVIFFRKFSRSAAEKIAELRESSPETLSKANVLWNEYLDGTYFKTTEGLKHVLGEFIAKDPNKFRDVNRVVNAASIPDIAKLLRKLPKSRIDWALLEVTETMPIVYNEGDTISQDGQILQLKNGQWVVIEKPKEAAKYVTFEATFSSAMSAFDALATYDDMREYSAYLTATSQYRKAPTWMKAVENSLERYSLADRPDAFKTFLVGLSVLDALDIEGRSSGVNFLEKYPLLSEAMKVNAVLAKRHKVKGVVKTGLDNIGFNYTRKGGYSNLWKGEVASIDDITLISNDGSFEGLIYKTKSPWVSLDDAKSIYGDTFDPYASEDWCISADGEKVIRADDYYTGNFSSFLRDIDVEIEEAADDKLKAKLLQQKTLAYSRIKQVDVNKMKFNIRSPYVTNEEKIEFLRVYIDKSADIEVDENGKERIKFYFKESQVKNDFQLKLYKRLAAYIETGNANLAGADFDGEEAEAIQDLRKLIATTNEQFQGWVTGNRRILERLDLVANDPKKQHFIQADDESPLVIQGMNPDLTLHGYQNSFVRKMSRGFEGINGFDVGLGKTFTSLAAVQYVQSIGVKKKTLFVVPNSVLSNWYKEAARAYSSVNDCLFVGLRDVDGKLVSNSSYYDEDLQRVLENNHSKIFVTMEAFERIKLKDETITDFESYLRNIDDSFAESENRKQDSKAKNKAKTLIQVLVGKTGSAPYLEDMGIDSIVIDEGHGYKNSSETVDFKGGKYLSVAKSSSRGMDAQAKAWYVRGKASKGDGVLLLTATPITNSPLEIYSMLSLAVGHGRVNDMALGTKGADQFMGAVCSMVNEEDEGIDGSVRDMQVFRGLTNTDMLKRSIDQVATIKDAKMVGKSIYVPEATNEPTDVALPDEMIERLQKYKLAYRYAAALAREKELPDEGEEEYEEMKNKFGEDDDVLGHPFNLIRKMTNLIADPDLDDMISTYVFAENDRENVEKAIAKWNAKPPKEEWSRLSPNTAASDIASSKTSVNKLNGEIITKYKVSIRAWVDGNRVCINSTNWDTQEKFEDLLTTAKLDLDVTIPPKLAALLENFKNECAKPRGVVKNENGEEVKLPYAKQIIFCDMLGMHNKIRKALVKHAGISASHIVIITGQRNNDPADLLDIQNGFNAVEDNKYRVIIANEKAEVGINLQIGTQANHHLTIGWTPDSLQQRNGRSARQGNLTDRVTSYFYDAAGTFDVAKRTLVNNKADWINNLLVNEGGNDVEIVGGMSRQHVEALIDSIGDADAVAKTQERMTAAEKEARIQNNRFKQMVNINTILKENQFLKENPTAKNWVAKVMGELLAKVVKKEQFTKRMEHKDATLTAIAKNKALADGVQTEINTLVGYISAAATFVEGVYRKDEPKEGGTTYEPVELVEFFLRNAKNGEKTAQHLVDDIKSGSVSYRTVYIEVNQESPLVDDWQSQVDMSESIRKNAAKAYEEQAEKEGAHAKGVTADFLNHGGNVFIDQIVTESCFLVSSVDNPTVALYGVGLNGINGGRVLGLKKDKPDYGYISSLIALGYKVVYPGTELHEQCLAFAAKYEDDLYNQGNWAESTLFSANCGVVAARRTTDIVTNYSYSYNLPEPYFPYVDSPSDLKDAMTLRKHIQEQQRAIIKKFEDNRYWVPNSIESVYNSDYNDDNKRNNLYRDYAMAHGLKMSYQDLIGYGQSTFIMKNLNTVEGYSTEKVTEVMNAADTEEGVKAAVIAYLGSVLPWFDFTSTELNVLLPFGLSYTYRDRIRQVKKAQEGDTAPQPVAVAENTDVPPVATDDNVDLSRLKTDLRVWVSGDGTRNNKERFKELGLQFMQDNPGYEAPKYWYGGGAKWLSKKLVWEMPYGAWMAFKQKFPGELNQLTAEVCK